MDTVFEVVARRLPKVGLDCLMIGGHAVNHYGVIRATQDIDFMIAATDADASNGPAGVCPFQRMLSVRQSGHYRRELPQ